MYNNRWRWKTKVLSGNPASVLRHSSQSPRQVPWDWTLASALRSGRQSSRTRVTHMKTLNMFYLVIYWTQKVHNDFIFLYSIVLPPVGHSSNHEYHCCNFARKSSCVSNFFRSFKVFIWLSLVYVWHGIVFILLMVALCPVCVSDSTDLLITRKFDNEPL